MVGGQRLGGISSPEHLIVTAGSFDGEQFILKPLKHPCRTSPLSRRDRRARRRAQVLSERPCNPSTHVISRFSFSWTIASLYKQAVSSRNTRDSPRCINGLFRGEVAPTGNWTVAYACVCTTLMTNEYSPMPSIEPYIYPKPRNSWNWLNHPLYFGGVRTL